jgi:methionine--tRNA ligase beta chain
MHVRYEDFEKLEIRIGKILFAERIRGTEKLLRLEVSLGDTKKQLVAGIAKEYEPSELIDKEIPILVNLEPRKIKGIESQGMLLAAIDGERVVLLHPDKEVSPGSKVK